MKYLTIDPEAGIRERDDLTPRALLEFVAEAATDHAMIADDLALVVG